MLRARFSKSREREELVTPEEINLYKFENFYWIAKRLAKGCCLRLVISPLNTPEHQKNYNSGKELMFEDSKDARISTIRVHHGKDYPSVIELPLNT